MLWKLQKTTLIPSQIVGYILTLFIGVSIILLTSQLYSDLKPLLFQESEVFNGNSAVVSKQVSVFKTLDKTKIYFSKEEFNELEEQNFVKELSKFNNASFKIRAYSRQSENIPVFYTDLFFESIPDKYLDVKPEEWKWDSTLNFIPIIIPENYLNLYNFGFAESQGLPVLSKNTISKVSFFIKISGNHKSKEFDSKIVGFSNKINSILVPENFLLWANNNYGKKTTDKTSRLLVEFKNPSDKAILKYFNDNNYSINKEKLEFSKLVFFFKTAFIFVFLIALIIIVLSISFILLSINLIIQKNKTLIINLYNIGYNHKKIAFFYQILISISTLLSIIGSIFIGILVRNYYLDVFGKYFEFKISNNIIFIIGAIFILILIPIYNFLLIRSIKKIVESKD